MTYCHSVSYLELLLCLLTSRIVNQDVPAWLNAVRSLTIISILLVIATAIAAVISLIKEKWYTAIGPVVTVLVKGMYMIL